MKIVITVKTEPDGFRFQLAEASRTLVQRLGAPSAPCSVFLSYETRMDFEQTFGKSVLLTQVPILLIGLSKAILKKHVGSIEYVNDHGTVIRTISL